MNIEKLIMLVQEKPYLYVSKHPDHKNKTVVRNSWETIGNELAVSSDEAKKKWRYIRDQYIKKKRLIEAATRSGAGADTKANVGYWPYLELLRFLDDNVMHRETTSNIIINEESNVILNDSAPSSSYIVDEDMLNFGNIVSQEYSELELSLNTDDVVVDKDAVLPTTEFELQQPKTPKQTRKCSPKKRKFVKNNSLQFQETISNAIKDSTANMNSALGMMQQGTVFDNYGQIVAKRLKDLGKKRASKAFLEICAVLDGFESDD